MGRDRVRELDDLIHIRVAQLKEHRKEGLIVSESRLELGGSAQGVDRVQGGKLGVRGLIRQRRMLRLRKG